jgi:hypothetical protein
MASPLLKQDPEHEISKIYIKIAQKIKKNISG